MRVPLALILVLAGAAAVPLSAGGLDEGKGEGKKDAEDRLLEAELLEVSTGDLEKAKAIYQAIQADEKAPESARARALLYLARCHRKLGEIEAARKLLGDLVKNHAAEREVLRQAQSFLRELAGGRPESPDFDWLKELERNPEIQARVFDLAMDLTNPSSDAGKRAQRQLLALGSLAVPVIERVIETTRDPGHRQLLAILLLHSGRFEKLAMVFGASSYHWQSAAYQALSAFVRTVPALPEESRTRLRGSLEKLPASAEKDPWRDILLLETGDTSKLPERLQRMEGNGILDAGVLERLFAREPAAVAALAERAADPGCPKDEVRRYVDFLLEKAPEKLALPHWKALFGVIADQNVWAGYLQKLEERGDFDVLAGLAAGGINPLNYLWSDASRLALRDPRWAGVLRAQKSFDRLNGFAEVVDGAIPELVSALKARAKEAPEYLGKSDHLNRKEGEAWTPSPAYAQAMVGLLGEKDPVVLAIALEALALSRDDSALKVEPAILKLLESTDDLQVKEFTLYALLRRSRGEGESGARAVRELFEEFQARSKVEMLPQAYLDSPLMRITSLGYVSRPGLDKPPPIVRRPRVPGRSLPPQRVPPGPRITSMTQTLEWVLNQAGEKLLLQLYPQVLSQSGTAEGAVFHEWFFLEQKDRTPALKVLIDRLDSFSGTEVRESVIRMLYGTLSIESAQTEQVMNFLKAAVQDRGLPTEARLKAFFWPENPNFDWLEWQRFFQSDDPLVGSFFAGLEQQPNPPIGNVYARFQKGRQQFSFNFWSWVSGRPDEEKAAIQDAALKSPHEAVRASAVHSVNRAEEPEFLRKALADPSPLVKSAAIHRLENTTRADVAPLVIELLGDNANRLAAIKILKRFADPRSIEPLVKLLDDPDTQVRSEARAALKEIRAALEEKREWEQVLKGLKPSPSEKPKGF